MSTVRNTKGLLGTKLGMTQTWDDQQRLIPVTVVAAGPCVVTGVRTAADHGYDAVQLGYGEIDPRRVNKPTRGFYDKTAHSTPRRHLIEVRTTDASTYEVGQELSAETFEVGDTVDISATSKGKGFAGVMKRHGFHGLRATHGVHKKHRAPGSIGGCATPGRVFKGMRMAGRMGGDTITTQNLSVHKVDAERGVLLIKGAVPGPNGGLVLIRTAAKAAVKEAAQA